MLYDALHPIATIFESASASDRVREIKSRRPWEQKALWWIPENGATNTENFSARESLLLLAILGLNELTFAFNRTRYIEKFLELNNKLGLQWHSVNGEYVRYQ
jgi:hypothetical protein